MDYEFRDPLKLARAVRIVVILWIVAMASYAASAAYTILSIGAFQAGTAGQEVLESVDTVGLVVSIPAMVINLVAIVLVARWIYRVNKNAHALSDSMVMTPGWNVGFFFIPIANLWKPFEGIRQTWRASASPAGAENVEVPGWLSLWWVSWILTNILGNISFRLGMRAETLDDYVAGGWIDLLCLPLDLVAGGTLLLLVTRLSQMQHDARDVEAQRAIFE